MSQQIEHQHQKALIEWFDRQYPSIKGRLFAIPNGGQRHPAVAAKLKAEGVRKGVPDLFLPIPKGGLHGLFIELKAPKGKPTQDQLDWLEELAKSGYMAALCKGWEAARDTIRSYLDQAEMWRDA